MTMGIGLGLGLGLTNGFGVATPSGFGFMVDENGARLIDEGGAFLIGQRYPAFATIKAAAAARGIKFGVASNTGSLTAAGSLIAEQFSMLGWTGAFKPASIQPTQGAFDWASVDDALAWSDAAGLPWRLHLLNYPAHDMDWVDGTSVTAGTWQGLIDAHFEAVAAHLAAHDGNGAPTSIDVSNELADGTQSDGFLRNPWYNAGGRAWCAYMFTKARELWPTTPLYLCQDLQEEAVPLYGDRRIAFLKIVDYLQGVGAPLDGVNLQGHLGWNRPWDPVAFRDQIKAFRDRGLKIIVGELDVQLDVLLGVSTDDYPPAEMDRQVAYRVAQYADIILPFVDGGEFMLWDISDADTSWGEGQRPCLYDADLTVKPAYYQALLEPMMTRR